MAWGALIAAGGAYLSSKKSGGGKAPKFMPYDVNGPGGSATFVPGTKRNPGRIDYSLNEPEQNIRDSLISDARNRFSGDYAGSGLAMDAQAIGGGSLLGLYDEFQNTPEYAPLAAYTAAQQFGGLANVQGQFGQSALERAFMSPQARGLSTFAAGVGSSLLQSANAPSFNQLAAERLSALRGSAQPQEERLVNRKFNSLFNEGRLGSTGGAQALGELDLALQQADMGRVIASQDFAQGQSNAERAFMQNQQQLGSSLLGQSLQGIGMDQQRASNFGSLGSGMLSQVSPALAAQLAAYQTGDQAMVSRGQRRLGNAQSLFGFGAGLDENAFNRAVQGLGLTQSMDAGLLQQAQLGASVGQMQTSAAQNAAALRANQGSAFGAALQGFGTAYANRDKENGQSFSQMFNGLFSRGRSEPQ